MRLAFDHYTLALSVLDGEPDGHRLLADLLDEQGERGLAQWVRKGRSFHRTTALFHLLPYAPVVLIACDAAQTALAGLRQPERFSDCFIEPVRSWAKSVDTDVDIDVPLSYLRNLAFPGHWKHESDHSDAVFAHIVSPELPAVVGFARQARAAELAGDDRHVRARTHDACNALRKLLAIGYTDAHWRVRHLRAALESLIAEE